MKQPFGITSDGKQAFLYTLGNAKGTQAYLTDYGASLVRFILRDKNGIPRDLVLGYDDVSGYEKGDSFIGATVGRVANRIGQGKFTLGGTTYELVRNDGPNTLHSGKDFYGKRLWEVKDLSDNSISFGLFSPDGDQGFPGNLTITVTYTLTEDDRLTIDYEAVSDADSPLNLTNHSYFNLGGHAGGSVLSQIAVIHADQVTEPDQNLIPNGNLVSIEDTAMDFREGKALGRDIDKEDYLLKLGNGYDHNYVLSGSGYREAASLFCPETGIRMTVFTDLPGMQVYTSNFLDQEPGKEGAIYSARDAVCFETQFFPDAINKENFPGGMIKAGEVFRSGTCYGFSVQD